jgi:L-asparaginase
MNKDSLEMTEQDHDTIAQAAELWSKTHDGVVIVHGTDRLAKTGERIFEHRPEPSTPVVLTGAMRPWEVRRTDADQNLTEALLAVQVLPPGVYAVLHNRVLTFPGVVKNTRSGTFVYRSELEE